MSPRLKAAIEAMRTTVEFCKKGNVEYMGIGDAERVLAAYDAELATSHVDSMSTRAEGDSEFEFKNKYLGDWTKAEGEKAHQIMVPCKCMTCESERWENEKRNR